MALYHFSDETLLRVETLNSRSEHMLARPMITAGFSPPKDLSALQDLTALKTADKHGRLGNSGLGQPILQSA